MLKQAVAKMIQDISQDGGLGDRDVGLGLTKRCVQNRRLYVPIAVKERLELGELRANGLVLGYVVPRRLPIASNVSLESVVGHLAQERSDDNSWCECLHVIDSEVDKTQKLFQTYHLLRCGCSEVFVTAG